VLSVDWRQPLSAVRARIGAGRVLQGNLDPACLLGPIAGIERATAAMLEDAAGGPHVANLGHGIFKQTDPAHARAFVAAVQRLSAVG
jgi:uroporphyrinogen decarboxylase